ncbi:hypothetical protein SMICM17S_07428 [Streptomyces microflavus]
MQLALLVAEGEQHALGDSYFGPGGGLPAGRPARLPTDPLGGILRTPHPLHRCFLTLACFGGWVGFVLPRFFVCG